MTAALAQFVGPTDTLAMSELVKAGASVDDLRSAMAFVDSASAADPRAYQALSPHMRRLVDLVDVAGTSASRGLCEGVDPMHNALDRPPATGPREMLRAETLGA